MLALIAGSGTLPAAIAQQQAQRPLVCVFEGFDPEGLEADLVFRLETLGTLLNDLKARGVTEVCFCGAIRRPPVDPSRIDAATLPLFAILREALGAGDDGALRAVAGLFLSAGFAVKGAAELAPGLLPVAGVPTSGQPTAQAEGDAARAETIVRTLSGADVGQTCAVLKGQALAIEGVFGTDWMLASLAARPDQGGGVMFKAPKVGQDRRVDLPTIGPDTVASCVAARLDGIVIEAGGVMVLDREAVISACDAAGLFLWVREPA